MAYLYISCHYTAKDVAGHLCAPISHAICYMTSTGSQGLTLWQDALVSCNNGKDLRSLTSFWFPVYSFTHSFTLFFIMVLMTTDHVSSSLTTKEWRTVLKFQTVERTAPESAAYADAPCGRAQRGFERFQYTIWRKTTDTRQQSRVGSTHCDYGPVLCMWQPI